MAARDVGVNLGRADVGVAEHRHGAQVGAAFDQMRGERVHSVGRINLRIPAATALVPGAQNPCRVIARPWCVMKSVSSALPRRLAPRASST